MFLKYRYCSLFGNWLKINNYSAKVRDLKLLGFISQNYMSLYFTSF